MVLVDESARVDDDQLAALRLAAASIVISEPAGGSAVAVIGYGSQPEEGPAYETICPPTQVVSAVSTSSALIDCAARVRRREPKDGDGADPVTALRVARAALDQMAPAGSRKIVFLLAGAPLAAAGHDGRGADTASRTVQARQLLSTTVPQEMRAAGVEVWPVAFRTGGQPDQEVNPDRDALRMLARQAGQPSGGCPAGVRIPPDVRFAATTAGLVPTALAATAAARCVTVRAADVARLPANPPGTGPPANRPAHRQGPPWWMFGVVVSGAVAGSTVVTALVSWLRVRRRGGPSGGHQEAGAIDSAAPRPSVEGLTIYLLRYEDPIDFLDPDGYRGEELFIRVLEFGPETMPQLASGDESGYDAVLRRNLAGGIELKKRADADWDRFRPGPDNRYPFRRELSLVVLDAGTPPSPVAASADGVVE
jgi:hypothetical protein